MKKDVHYLDGSVDRLQIDDNGVLSRMVSARLDLPVSQRLLNQPFRLSVIKRCWEDQLRLNGRCVSMMERKNVVDVVVGDDFVAETDLWLACEILQKQIDCIGGKKENIVIPRVAMYKTPPSRQLGIHYFVTSSHVYMLLS